MTASLQEYHWAVLKRWRPASGQAPRFAMLLSLAIDELLCRVEVILVDDGSIDATYALMLAWAAADPAIKLIALSRNFGHQIAITAGMTLRRGMRW